MGNSLITTGGGLITAGGLGVGCHYRRVKADTGMDWVGDMTRGKRYGSTRFWLSIKPS